jgi:hypothetical protein
MHTELADVYFLRYAMKTPTNVLEIMLGAKVRTQSLALMIMMSTANIYKLLKL